VLWALKRAEYAVISQVMTLKRATCLRPGAHDGCPAKLVSQRSSLSGRSVIVGRQLGGELPGGSTGLLTELTASIVPGRIAVAVWSQPDGVRPRRLALVLLS
jgi:hypothetical protein